MTDASRSLLPLRPLRKVCHRYGVEAASGQLGIGHLWPEERREKTLALMRSLPTYDRATDTVVVCRYV
jgi:hypothetical protein